MISGNAPCANAAPASAVNDAIARVALHAVSHARDAARLAAAIDMVDFTERWRALATRIAIATDVIDAIDRHTLADPMFRVVVRTTHWAVAAREGWQPVSLEWHEGIAEIRWQCGGGVRTEGFETAHAARTAYRPFNRLCALVTPLTRDFCASLEAAALPLRGLVFHESRCGSTWLAQALKAWRGTRVVSEAPAIDTAILAIQSGADQDAALLRAVVAAFAQPGDHERQLVIKLDAWHVLARQRIVDALAVPWLFVYRDPVEVLASHRRMGGTHVVPGALPTPWLGEGIDTAAPPLHFAAQVLGALCRAGLEGATRKTLLNYDEMPLAIDTVATRFGLGDDIDRHALAATLAADTKRVGELYIDDAARKRADADAALFEACSRWMDRPYAQLQALRKRLRRRRLPVAVDLEGLRADLAAVCGETWHPHFNTGYYLGDWSGIALRAQAHARSPLLSDPTIDTFADTAAMAQCPHVQALLAALACPIDAVRFLRLGAGSEIREHRDAGLCFEEGVARLHVPVLTHEAVEFFLDGERMQLRAGECWYLDFDLPHRVVNPGPGDRVHLVIDVRVNARLRELLKRVEY